MRLWLAWIGRIRSIRIVFGAVGTDAVETGVIPSAPEAVAVWINTLRKRFQGKPIALCLEQSKGALIHQLMSVECIDIYPINPLETAESIR